MGNTESRNDNIKESRNDKIKKSRNDNVKTFRKKPSFSRIGSSHVKTNSISPDFTESTSSCNIKTVSNIKILGGRPYLDDEVSIYLFPADWEEADRVQTCHFALKHLLGGNCTAPLSDIIKPESKVLDVGCGSGHWCFEIAQEFPEADVYGIDIISSFPSEIKPSNCYFQECNITDGLPFEDNDFDYVFMRHMFLALRDCQWVPLLNEIMRVLKPGGVFEFVEFDLIPQSIGPVYSDLINQCNESLKNKQIDLQFLPKFDQTVIDVGFQNVNCIRKNIPLGRWDKNIGKIGEIWTSNMFQMSKSLNSLITSIVNNSDEDHDRILSKIYFEEVDLYHSYQVHYIILATKSTNDVNN
ncbi:S-adenosyl-L-methionine-dependent methyltransferase [Gigaspora margarita]|uniref:S-adenosyl-L-methionine-dependent methyltransferase n=1 Tax=Gigaspora margarita TaxID=4874 RepID=A0A8H4AXJ2_GIGMA|nr:S-adenosyl-L-methionine-dependent methyltransferase [Gigaspora margarita]